MSTSTRSRDILSADQAGVREEIVKSLATDVAEELTHAQLFAKRIIELTDGIDPVTQDMLITILADEQNHLRTFEGFAREYRYGA